MSVAKGFRLSDDSTASLDWNYVTNSNGSKTIIEEVNDVKQDLSEYEAIFTADVSESVSNWLDEHPEATTTVEDNTIATAKIVDGAVTDEKVSTILGFSRPEIRVIYNKQTIQTLTGGSTYAYMQGSAYIASRGNWVIAFRNSASTSVMLVEIEPDFETVYNRYTLDLGHANSMCYNSNTDKLYVATMSDGGNANSIVEINASTMDIVKTYPVTSPYAVTYDYDNDLYYIGYGASGGIAIYDSSFTSVGEIIFSKSTLYDGEYTVTTQDMTYYNGHILYLCSIYGGGDNKGYIISVIDVKTGQIVSKELYGTYDATEEAESLTIVNSIGYVFTGNKYFRVSNFSLKKTLHTKIDAFGLGTRLPDNTDLNDVLVYGKYFSSNSDHTSTMQNLPISSGYQGFTLYVFQHVYFNILQVFITNSYDIYIRRYDANGNLYPWRVILGVQSYGITSTHTIGKPICRRQGNLVTLSFVVTTIASTAAWDVLASVPSDCRPVDQVTFVGLKGSTVAIRTQIGTNGDIKVAQSLNEGDSVFVAVSYPIS